MIPILINLIFVSGFCFLLIVVLEYAIYLWETKRVNDMTKDILPTDSIYEHSVKREFSTNNLNPDNFNAQPMKNPINSKYFERSLVLVQSQDYKGWLEKFLSISKKILTNLGFYIKKTAKYILSLSKSGNNFPDHEEKYGKTVETSGQINETVAKINEINEKESQQITPSHQDIPSANIVKEDFVFQENSEKVPSSSMATLNLATDTDNTEPKDTTTYDKIEKSILQKLQEVGLNHYDIWLELGHFYQKYEEKEKAKEIFAMVMKHAEGKDKELARDGLIALS
jgi:hypothetical protein